MREEGELPEGWRVARLTDVAEVQLGKMLDKAKQRDGSRLPYLRNANVRWDAFDLSDLLEMPFSKDEVERFRLKPGDLVVCEGGEPGRSAVWREATTEVKFQKALLRVRPGGDLVPEWLGFAFRRDSLSGDLEAHFTGSTIKHFTRQALLEYSFSLPPRPEQERVVERIEGALSEVELVHERLTSARTAIRRFRQAVLAAACDGRLTEGWRNAKNALSNRMTDLDDDGQESLPVGWRRAVVRDLAEIKGGIQKQPKRAPKKNAYPYLRVANVLRGRVVLDRLERMELFAGELETYRLIKNDLLIVEGNGSPSEIGRSALWTGEIRDCVHQNHIIRVRARSCNPRYLNLYWNSPQGIGRISQEAVTTTGLLSLSTKKVGELEVPLAPDDEQHEIVRRVEDLFALADSIEKRVAAASARTDKLTQAILAKAFRGELVPTEAELNRRRKASTATPHPADRPAAGRLAPRRPR